MSTPFSNQITIDWQSTIIYNKETHACSTYCIILGGSRIT